MNSVENQVERWLDRFLVTKDVEGFIRPMQLAGGQVPSKAAGMTERLGLGKIGFAATQSGLGSFKVLNVSLRYVPTIDATIAVAMGIGSK